MKLVANPIWFSARYEIRLINREGFAFSNKYPLRFTDETKDKAIELLQAGKWKELKELSIPPEIMEQQKP